MEQERTTGGGEAAGEPVPAPAGKGDGAVRRTWRRRLPVPATRAGRVVVLLPLILLFAYYAIGLALLHRIDDDPDPPAFAGEGSDAGAYVSVLAAAYLLERELPRWVPNDPWFMPGHVLDNMPNFQKGIVGALASFSFELKDRIGRLRGSSQVDADLAEAAGQLQYPADRWVYDLSTSILPTASSEAQYAKAAKALASYRKRLLAGQAVFDRRADNLLAVIDRIALDLGSLSAVISERLAEGGGWLDSEGDDVFYATKGRLYAYYVIMRALESDFANIIRDKELGNAWQQMLDSLRAGALLDPVIIVTAPPSSLFRPNHLAAQGFYLLRGRTQLREITNILLK